MLEFRYLPAFFSVAETKSFTGAGKALHIATSAVSRQIQLLEEACNTQLVFRSPQEVSLTDAGKRLYEEMKYFQAKSQAIIGEESASSLKLGTLQGVLQYWFVDVMAQSNFLKNLNLEIKLGNPSELITQVEEGILDAVFFSYVHRTQVPKSLRVYRLFPEEIVLISKKKISLDQIDRFPWICLTPNTWIVRFQRKLPTRHITVNHMNTIVELVKRDLGIAMVPSYVVKQGHGLHIQKVPKFSNEHICLAIRHYERLPKILEDLLNVLKPIVPSWKEL